MVLTRDFKRSPPETPKMRPQRTRAQLARGLTLSATECILKLPLEVTFPGINSLENKRDHTVLVPKDTVPLPSNSTDSLLALSAVCPSLAQER